MAYVGKKPQPFYLGQVDDLNVATDVTVDTDTFFVSASGDRVGINKTNTTGSTFTVQNVNDTTYNTAEFYNDNGNRNFRFAQDTSGNATLLLEKDDGTDTILFNTNGDSYINGGNVGIGASNPQSPLDIGVGGSTSPTYKGNIRLLGGGLSANGGLEFVNTTFSNGYGWRIQTPDLGSGNVPIVFQHRDNSTAWTERMRIDSDGSVRQTTGVYAVGFDGSSFASGERGYFAFAGSTNDQTYVYGRNVVDGSFVYYAIVASNVKIKFTAEGNGYWDGTGDLGAADYAEYFEWADGNTSEEDRRGYSVILDNGKIRKATADDDTSQIIGIISAFPAIVGDSKSLGWHGKWATDEFGARLTRPLEYYEWTDESGEKHEYRGDAIPEDVTIPDDATMTIRHEQYYADDYDPDVEYIPRSERPEWDAVGMLGKLILRKGEPVGDRWIKLEDVSDTLEKWLVR